MRRNILHSAIYLALLLLLMLPAVVQAQFTYTVNHGTITITGYTGPGGDVNIPDWIPETTNGLPVTTIGSYFNFHYNAWLGAFAGCSNLTSVTMGTNVTSIGAGAFDSCNNLTNVNIGTNVTSIGDSAFSGSGLTSVTIPNSVTSIGDWAFDACQSLASVTILGNVTNIGEEMFWCCFSLTSVTIGNGVTSIGEEAFFCCYSLTDITIPNSVTSIGDGAFGYCDRLTSVYFQGNAPSIGSYAFSYDSPATVYYLPGTTGWGATFAGRPTALWKPQIQSIIGSFDAESNHFGFNITWASGRTVVVEASSNLGNPTWSPISTNTLTSGSIYFSDPRWTNHQTRFYRIRSP